MVNKQVEQYHTTTITILWPYYYFLKRQTHFAFFTIYGQSVVPTPIQQLNSFNFYCSLPFNKSLLSPASLTPFESYTHMKHFSLSSSSVILGALGRLFIFMILNPKWFTNMFPSYPLVDHIWLVVIMNAKLGKAASKLADNCQHCSIVKALVIINYTSINTDPNNLSTLLLLVFKKTSKWKIDDTLFSKQELINHETTTRIS